MNFTKEDYDALYKARYSVAMENKTEDSKAIIRGTFVEIFQNYDFNDIIYYLAFPLDLLFRFLPMVIERLSINANKQVFKPEESIKLDSNKNLLTNVARREHYGALKDQYNVNKEEKVNRAEAINKLRKYLYANDLVLEGALKNSKVTFNKELSSLLKIVVPQIKDIKLIESKLKEIYQEDIKVVIK